MNNIKQMIKRLESYSNDNSDIIHILTNYLRICGLIDLDISQLYENECSEILGQIKKIVRQ